MKIVVLMEDGIGKGNLLYEHGLSIYIETKEHKILLDTGKSEKTLDNARALNVPLNEVDTLVLSHGHYDHSGGILSFYKINQNARIYMRRNAGGDYYNGERFIGIDKEILKLPNIIYTDDYFKIDENLFLFSKITGRREWPASNKMLSKKESGRMLSDDFTHEQCLVVKEDGNEVLFSGCAHNGILNILDRYKDFSEKEATAVFSGFHMMKSAPYEKDEEAVIKNIGKELRNSSTVFYSGHCTGDEAYSILKEEMQDNLHKMYPGLEIII